LGTGVASCHANNAEAVALTSFNYDSVVELLDVHCVLELCRGPLLVVNPLTAGKLIPQVVLEHVIGVEARCQLELDSISVVTVAPCVKVRFLDWRDVNISDLRFNRTTLASAGKFELVLLSSGDRLVVAEGLDRN